MPSDNRSRLIVPPERQRITCDPETAVPSAEASDIIGQEEALDAVKLGLELTNGEYASRHYNVLVVGPSSTGRTKKTLTYVRCHAAAIGSAPPDVVCVPDFENKRRPSVACLPAGQGAEFKRLVAELHSWSQGGLKKALGQLRLDRDPETAKANRGPGRRNPDQDGSPWLHPGRAGKQRTAGADQHEASR
jgi:hypothetical protein